MTSMQQHDGSAQPTGAIIARLRGGDDRALGALLERYWKRSVLLAEAYMSSEVRVVAEPEDVAQDAWIAVYHNLDGFEYRDQGSFFAWLGSIVRNRLVDVGRYARAGKRLPAGAARFLRDGAAVETPQHVLERIAAEQTSPSDRAARSESFARLREALRSLTSREREVIALRFLEELSVKETADRLQVSEGAVKMATLRGLETLHGLLGSKAELAM